MTKLRAAKAALRLVGAALIAAPIAFHVAPPALAAPSDFFRITVVDEDTGRGVPLVELRTVNEIRFVTDSAGVAAVIDPEMMGQNIYFRVSSPGYEYPKDNFGYRGIALKVVAGGSATIRLKRVNIAERLYRITGAGIYRDSVLTGQKVPIAQPLLNGLVLGQDTVEVMPYRGKLYWFYGDTNRPSYPLGQFATSGATSLTPGQGGLDPSVGVDLTYWVDKDGFSKKMIPLPNASGPTWVGGLFTLTENGQERLYTHYAIVDGSMKSVVSGLAVFDDAKAEFRSVHTYATSERLIPEGHPFYATVGGTRYVYFNMTARGAFPLVRTVADLAHVQNPAQFESFTCLAPGNRFGGTDTPLERGADGKLVWAWKRNTAALGDDQAETLVKAGKMRADEALLQLRSVEDDKKVSSHGGSVFWNPYRKRWIQIATEVNGSPSFLGEVWFSEADTPVGPWTYARHIVTHNHYTFYNPTQDRFFDQDGGRIVYFEGTYVATFSDVKDLTPRYDYNQLMYRLTLDDPRLTLPEPVYELSAAGGGSGGRWGMREKVAAGSRWNRVAAIPFYAVPPERARPAGMIPLFATTEGGLAVAPSQAPTAANVLCYALPAAASAGEKENAAIIPLYAFHDTTTGKWRYATVETLTGATRVGNGPICRVWRNPSSVLAFDGSAVPVP